MNSERFFILSLKHSDGKTPCFWGPDASGYTIFPWKAGVYLGYQVKADPSYYNNGETTLAIPITNDGMKSIGFECRMDPEKVAVLSEATIKKSST